MNNPSTGAWGYPKLDFGNGVSSNGSSSPTNVASPHSPGPSKIAPLPPIAKSSFEQLMALKVDENALEQLDKVAMFFNSQMPTTATPGADNSIYRTLPNSPITPTVTSAAVPLGRSFGPIVDSDAAMSIRDVFAARTVSLYPMIPGTKHREGDPICDRFECRVYDNRAVLAVADGCNWGSRPREAATKATEGFCGYLESRFPTMHDIQEAGHLALRAFSVAHNRIVEGKQDIYDAGTCTMIGGILMGLPPSSDGRARWSFILGSVGDCKAFHYSTRHDAITDVTELNRLMSNSLDSKDPGGRLGPYVGHEGLPDLRNLGLFHLVARENDLIILVSDGVHDNFDPILLGKRPNEITTSTQCASWDELPPIESEKLRTRYRNTLMRQLIRESRAEPKELVNRIIDHSNDITRPSRSFMENNYGKKQPADQRKFPGKMDHATAVCLRVTHFAAAMAGASARGGN